MGLRPTQGEENRCAWGGLWGRRPRLRGTPPSRPCGSRGTRADQGVRPTTFNGAVRPLMVDGIFRGAGRQPAAIFYELLIADFLYNSVIGRFSPCRLFFCYR